VFVYYFFGMRGARLGEGCDGWFLVGKDVIGSVFFDEEVGNFMCK